MLIDERLRIQEGRKVSVTPSEDDVTAILTDMAQKNNLNVEGLATALGKAGVNIKTLKDRIPGPLVWQATVQEEVPPRHPDRRRRRGRGAGGGRCGEAAPRRKARPLAAAAEPALQLRQIKYALPTGADQQVIAGQLAAAESMRARFKSCADLTNGVQGAN